MKRYFVALVLLLATPLFAAAPVTTICAAQDAGGNVIACTPVLALNPDGTSGIVGFRSATITDGSGTVATGGTSQQVFAANAARTYLTCQNPVAASETLFVNIGAAASTTAGSSYELAAGASLTFQTNFIPTGAVNVTAVTSTHKFICKQG